MTEQALSALLDALADALCDRLAARLEAGRQTYTAAQLAERYGTSTANIHRLIRAGAFGETINVGERTKLVTAKGLREFENAHTGPGYTRKERRAPRRSSSRPDPGPI